MFTAATGMEASWGCSRELDEWKVESLNWIDQLNYSFTFLDCCGNWWGCGKMVAYSWKTQSRERNFFHTSLNRSKLTLSLEASFVISGVCDLNHLAFGWCVAVWALSDDNIILIGAGGTLQGSGLIGSDSVLRLVAVKFFFGWWLCDAIRKLSIIFVRFTFSGEEKKFPQRISRRAFVRLKSIAFAL